MRRSILLILTGIVLVSAFQSCYKDLGNYEYKTLDVITIDASDPSIQTSYAVYRFDTLRIAPKVYFNDELVDENDPKFSNLEYTWSIFQAMTSAVVYSRDTLSHHIALEAPIGKPSGQWIVHLAVTDTNTGLQEYLRFGVQVDETISDGWLVLYETEEGDTDLGLIVDDYNKNGVIKDRVFTDLYAGTNGRHMRGAPKSMMHSAACLGSGEIIICSANELEGVDRTSFEPTFPFSSLFWEAPDIEAPTAVSFNNYRKEAVINNNRVHTSNFMMSGTTRTNYFGDASLGDYGTLANWLSQCPAYDFDAVVYDQTNQRFLFLPYNGVVMTSFIEQDLELAAFDVNNIGMQMIASDYGRDYYEYSLMRSGSTNRLYITDFFNSDQSTTDLGKEVFDMTGFPGVDEAVTLSAPVSGEYLYYGGGQGVYIYKYHSGNKASLAWKAPAGETVTCVTIQKFNYRQIYEKFMPYPSQVVYIATFGSTGNSGKVYEYMIDPASGEIDLSTERIREGFGRIVNMCYKWTF